MADDKKKASVDKETSAENVEQGKDEKTLSTRKSKNTKEKVYNNRIEMNPTLEEESDLDEALDRQQRRQRAITMRRYKSKIAAGRRKAARRPATMDKLKKRARKKAIEVVRQKVAQKQGANYATLDASQKAMIDKRVEKKKALVDRIAKKLVPQVRVKERERMSARRSVDEQFELFFESPTKRFHQARKNDGSIKLDRRFRAFRKASKPMSESSAVERLKGQHKAERMGLSAEQEREMDRAKTRELRSKIQKINREFVEYEDDADLLNIIEMVAEDMGTPKHHLGIGSNFKHMLKHAVRHVDYDMDGDVDQDDFDKTVPDEITGAEKKDLTKAAFKKYSDEKKHTRKGVAFEERQSVLTLDEQFEIQFLGEEGVLDKALAAMHRHITSGSSLMDIAYEVSRAAGVNKTSRELERMYKQKYGDPVKMTNIKDLGVRIGRAGKKYGIKAEQYGAGFEGTDTATQNLKADTPGEKGARKKPKISDWSPNVVDAPMPTIREQRDQCQLVGQAQIKEFEKLLDKLFAKYDIDFQFTKHFRERMSDERNDPCITLKELAQFMKKMYEKQGRPLKGLVGTEAVLKDIQRDLNIPVAVKYDERNDEIDVVMKTIMRKKDFRTPNKIVKY